MTDQMTHAVIVPHYNDQERLIRCLKALVPQMTAGVELVVCDNNSTQDLSDFRAQFPDVRIVTESNKGAGMARNRGVRETTAPVLLFIDCDCVPGPNWLAHALTLDVDGAVIGGRVDVFDETPPPRSGAEVFETVFAFQQKEYIEQKGFSVTANLITTRAVFEVTGPFDTGVSEDVDWCQRAVKVGFDLRYDDDLAVSHPTRQDWVALARKWRRLTDEMFLLNGVGGKDRLRWALRALMMPLSAVIHSPKILGFQGLTWGERLRGIFTLFAQRLTRCSWMLRQAIKGAA